MSTHDWWFAVTRYQPSCERPSTPSIRQRVGVKAASSRELVETQLSASATRARDRPRRAAARGSSALTRASRSRGVAWITVLAATARAANGRRRNAGRTVNIP